MSRARVLCLHGYHGSAATLRAQTRGFAAGVDDLADFVAVDAPALAERDHGWWHAGPTGARGWERTRAWVARLVERDGPFDGAFGFSQGAALAALLCGIAALDLRFAMMVGGFVSNDPSHAPLYDALRTRDLPSLHLIGRADGIVAPAASRALAARFRTPLVLEHDGGHVIAASPTIRSVARGFLVAQAEKRRAAPGSFPLWPGRAQSMRIVYPTGASRAPRPALLIFRGGGYSHARGSGAGAAEWAAEHGMVGIEVPYSTRADGASYPRPFDDAARAVRLTRAHAAEWGIDPQRVGVMGFSAGGHLATLLATQPTLHVSPDDDLGASISARPDLLVLAYPVVSFVDGYAPGAYLGTVDNFFGRRDVDEATRRQFSSELHVAPDHPPTFVWTTEDDEIVPSSHAKLFAEACRRAHVPVELVVYPHGPHGLGLALDQPDPVRGWTARLLEWLNRQWPAADPR